MSIVPSPPANATPTARGLMSAADKAKLDAQSGANSGDVTVSSPAGWLSLASQALTFALVSASASVAGVVDLAAQTFAGVKTFTSAIIASAGVQLSALWNTNGTGASDVGVKVGVSTADASVNAGAKLFSVRTGLGGTEVEYFSVTPKAAAFSALLNVNLGSGTHRRLMNITGVGAGDCNMVWSLGSGDFRVGPAVNGLYGTHRTLALTVNGNADAPSAIEGIRFESTQNPTRVVVRVYAPSGQSAPIEVWRVGSTDVSQFDFTGRLDQSGTDSSGTPGAATINKPTGKSAIASGATTVRITNSLVAAGDQVHVTWHGDHGQTRSWVTTGAGFFDVNLNAAASANTAFCWTVSKRI